MPIVKEKNERLLKMKDKSPKVKKEILKKETFGD